MVFVLISIVWSIGPVLAFPGLEADLQLVVPFIWIGALIIHSSLFSYRSLLLFAIVMATKLAALTILLFWAGDLGLIPNLPAAFFVAILVSAFCGIGGLHRRQMDVAIESAQRDLQEALELAEAANIAKSQFLASMSHELRTPLNAVIGYSEILMEDLEEAKMESGVADARRIHGAAHNLLGLINDVLDLAKIESGKMDDAVEGFHLPMLVNQAVDLVRPALAANNNTVAIMIDPDIHEVRSDEGKLRQCLLNLLSNASKFTKSGEINVSVTRSESEAGSHLVFVVKDTGIGISSDSLPRLFSAFTQANASISRAYGGTGLGLAITRKIARFLGGDVSVESEIDRGSTFTLTVLDQSVRSGEVVAETAKEKPVTLNGANAGPLAANPRTRETAGSSPMAALAAR